MRKAKITALGIAFLIAKAGFCQQPVKERDTLQVLLDEVRQLRQAIEGMTSASQRVQIARYGLQMQDSAVARATERMDRVRVRCAEAEGIRRHTAEEIRRVESTLASGAVPEGEAKELKSRLPEVKNAFEVQTAEAQNCEAAETEASTQ